MSSFGFIRVARKRIHDNVAGVPIEFSDFLQTGYFNESFTFFNHREILIIMTIFDLKLIFSIYGSHSNCTNKSSLHFNSSSKRFQHLPMIFQRFFEWFEEKFLELCGSGVDVEDCIEEFDDI